MRGRQAAAALAASLLLACLSSSSGQGEPLLPAGVTWSVQLALPGHAEPCKTLHECLQAQATRWPSLGRAVAAVALRRRRRRQRLRQPARLLRGRARYQAAR